METENPGPLLDKVYRIVQTLVDAVVDVQVLNTIMMEKKITSAARTQEATAISRVLQNLVGHHASTICLSDVIILNNFSLLRVLP